jgi:uncharacterized RDD family membrane protein YckC
MTVGMTYPVSTPPPGASQPALAPAPKAAVPVTGLKQLDGKRVLARLIDALIVGVPSAIAQTSTEEFGAYWVFMALSLVYFFVCEATMAQTVGKRVMRLRVMTRDGGAPSVNAISIRTVLRLIDDGPIGLVVMVLSGERRQRLGDLAAGTAVGAAEREVPRPEANALLVVYPVAWLIGAFGFITLTPSPASAADYAQQATQICRLGEVQSEPDEAGWAALFEEMRDRHAALTPPPDLAAVHATLVRNDGEMAQVMREMAAAHGDQGIIRRLFPTQGRLMAEREQIIKPYLPGCA